MTAELSAADDYVLVRVPVVYFGVDGTLAITDAARVFFTQAAERMRTGS